MAHQLAHGLDFQSKYDFWLHLNLLKKKFQCGFVFYVPILPISVFQSWFFFLAIAGNKMELFLVKYLYYDSWACVVKRNEEVCLDCRQTQGRERIRGSVLPHLQINTAIYRFCTSFHVGRFYRIIVQSIDSWECVTRRINLFYSISNRFVLAHLTIEVIVVL